MKATHAGLLVLLALAAAPAAAAAQKLETGTWTGTITPPNSSAIPLTYDVTMAGDTTKITLNAPESRTFPFEGVKLADGKLMFSWTPNVRLNCVLDRQTNGSYSGECRDEGGTPGHLVMTPPKK